MKIITDWDHCKFISESEKEKQILKELYETIKGLDDVYLDERENEIRLKIITYW